MLNDFSYFQVSQIQIIFNLSMTHTEYENLKKTSIASIDYGRIYLKKKRKISFKPCINSLYSPFRLVTKGTT